MEGGAHLQRNHFELLLSCEFTGPLDGLRAASNHDLTRAIEVGRRDDLPLGGLLAARRPSRGPVNSQLSRSSK
jgi:hypothetical protein